MKTFPSPTAPRLTQRAVERMHGIDERIEICEYEIAIRTYRQLVLDASGSRTTKGPQFTR
jgi:acetylornithine deacetylase/succinyl-diaminopimelate desuccinylase-like protein